MGAYLDIRTAIVEVLTTVQVSGNAAFEAISTNPTAKFDGFPAAVVVPAEVDSEIATNAQNDRSYGYNVHLQYAVQNSWNSAVDNMLLLIDACLDALDQTIDLNGECDILKAVPSGWDVEKSGEDLVLVATLHVVAVKTIDVM